MPVEAKPLFRPEVLRNHLRMFQWPADIDQRKATIIRWAELLATKQADKFKEKDLLPDFIGDIFCGVLGYTRPADTKGVYTLSREQHVQVDGKFADAVLGRFRSERDGHVIALEGKGPLDPLDRPFAGRKMSAVDQGYRYAINLPCDWIIVTSMRQIRLYFKGADQYTYERFDMADLAREEPLLKRFLFLLGATRIVPEGGRCHLYELHAASETVGKEVTKDFYFRYAEMRQNAFEHLCAENPQVPRTDTLAATQKLLDRILFCAFCEDRGLLPAETIRKAYEHRDPYHPKPIWDNFRGLFRAIDDGNDGLNIPRYNGGLFAHDPLLDELKLPDGVCHYFRDLAEYDYRPATEVIPEAETSGQLVDVDILGHIFEQSITDLERLRNEIEGRVEPTPREKLKTRRKKEGAFYTPAFITRYIVEQALGSVLSDRFEELRQRHEADAKGTARSVLGDPKVYDPDALKKPQRDALVQFWEAWQDELKTIRVLDPACGSGAFLIEAFDQLLQVYQTSNDRLEELRGSRTLFDPDREILQHNLYGVDLNDEAIEICRLSLWIKTAAHGKVLTSLDHSIRVGNSVVSDPAVHPRAFDWHAAFPEVFEQGGFDVVVGNPPYIRQEWLTPYKSHFESRFPEAYAGTADIYVYFYALGLQLLNRTGRLAFISSNAFARAGYAERLRTHLQTAVSLRQFIDLGDTQVFSDAKDVYPAMVVVDKQPFSNSEREAVVRTIRLRRTCDAFSVAELVDSDGWNVPLSRLTAEGWQFEPEEVVGLRRNLLARGAPLNVFMPNKICLGIKTGLNDAFLLTELQRKELIEKDKASELLIRGFIGGQHIRRWHLEDSGTYAIVMPSGFTSSYHATSAEEGAWKWLSDAYPAIAAHLEPFATRGRKRTDQGQFWWELRACDYYDAFDAPKICYPDIAKSNRFCLDTTGVYASNTSYLLPTSDEYLLGVLNSKATWFALGGISIPFGERAGEYRYRLFSQYIERLPIPDAEPSEREIIGNLAHRCSELGPSIYELQTQFQRRLLQTFGHATNGESLGTLNQKAQEWWTLSLNELGDALKTSFKLKGNPFKKPQTADEWEPYLAQKKAAVDALTRQLSDAEAELNDRVYKLFDLTPAEIALLQREVEH